MDSLKQIEDALFFTALHITDAAARLAFLDKACGGDLRLRSVVEDMLAAEEGADHLLDRGLDSIIRAGDGIDGLEKSVVEIRDERIGTRIGPYLLKESLGKGGGGVVYLAEQHEPVLRKVALKVIKLGMDTRSVIARFEAERQALAMMDHPYIARVLDAGSTAFGRPYFVLELVNGTPITEFCNFNEFTLRERIGLVINVCHAIQHAHQKGIIHRDIKPSNVLVSMQDDIAVPKVIDFGIAKAIEGNIGVETSQTMQGQLLGTPAYMSPEQACIRSSDIDTRADIYSLGALLYEIVTGHPPFEADKFAEVPRSELPGILAREEPPKPSDLIRRMGAMELTSFAKALSTEPSRLISMIRGDLDWIIVKAMEKDRTRRYETANGLAMDLQRFLDNQPISARPPGRAYVLRKLVRRNRAVFVSSALVLLALVGGFGTSTVLFLKARRAELRQAELRHLTEVALDNEANLRRAAETRSRLTEAVARVRQGDFDGGSKILGEMETPPSEPSLDAITALRDIGMWHGGHKRWDEARKCFEWLMAIDKLDTWRTVTLNYQACGALLAHTGDQPGYQRFCKILCETHSQSEDGDETGRILKSCLLKPLTPELRTSLGQLANTTEIWLESLGTAKASPWGSMPVALWKHRIGDDEAAIRIATESLENSNPSMGFYPSLHSILAMAHARRGDLESAKIHLRAATSSLEAKWESDLSQGIGGAEGYWYDWLFARVLVEEATQKATPP